MKRPPWAQQEGATPGDPRAMAATCLASPRLAARADPSPLSFRVHAETFCFLMAAKHPGPPQDHSRCNQETPEGNGNCIGSGQGATGELGKDNR